MLQRKTIVDLKNFSTIENTSFRNTLCITSWKELFDLSEQENNFRKKNIKDNIF
jgi:hypothetical protein